MDRDKVDIMYLLVANISLDVAERISVLLETENTLRRSIEKALGG